MNSLPLQLWVFTGDSVHQLSVIAFLHEGQEASAPTSCRLTRCSLWQSKCLVEVCSRDRVKERELAPPMWLHPTLVLAHWGDLGAIRSTDRTAVPLCTVHPAPTDRVDDPVGFPLYACFGCIRT